MSTIFNKIELDLAAEIINIGLAKAADSLSFFIQQKVFIGSKNFTIEETCKEEFFNKSSEPLTLLSTEIRGNMHGYCYLIFNKEEVQKLHEMSLPKSIRENPEQLEEVGKAMLMEMDNIITPAVVTQFSNLFKIEMYGHVPYHFSGTKSEANSYISQHDEGNKFCLHFNTTLSSLEKNIAPEFLWRLDDSFINAIKEFAKRDNVISRLQN